MMNNKYKIECGTHKSLWLYYIVYIQKSFLGHKYWSDLGTFDNEGKAREFITKFDTFPRYV